MKQIVLIALVMMLNSCGKKCRTYKQYDSAPVILEYFGNYKPGNYWIYENQNGTKRDSMWVSDYVNKNFPNVFSCNSFENIKFLLNSEYITPNGNCNVLINIEENSDDGKMKSFVRFYYSVKSNNFIFF